jgi:hypothetical protein
MHHNGTPFFLFSGYGNQTSAGQWAGSQGVVARLRTNLQFVADKKK